MAEKKQSSGANWDVEEEERLRILWAELVNKMEGRSEAAVRTRLAQLAANNYHHNWPWHAIQRTGHFIPQRIAR